MYHNVIDSPGPGTRQNGWGFESWDRFINVFGLIVGGGGECQRNSLFIFIFLLYGGRSSLVGSESNSLFIPVNMTVPGPYRTLRSTEPVPFWYRTYTVPGRYRMYGMYYLRFN